MFITHSNFFSSSRFSYLFSRRGIKNPYLTTPTSAKKRDFSEIPSSENKGFFPLKIASNYKFLIQTGIGVFALGFIDAGYSGDWSRIGVISTGTEDLLKAAAFLVVPLCLFLIFFFYLKSPFMFDDAEMNDEQQTEQKNE